MKQNEKPILALVASAIRPHLWKKMYNFLKQTNKTPFIMIFCGHIEPNYALPDDFIYIYSEMKAPACVEISYRHAYTYPNIKYVMNVTDDCILPENLLDFLISEMKKFEDSEMIIGPGFSPEIGGKPVPLIYHNNDLNSPVLTVFALMRVSSSKKIGSIDKRFEGIYWDCDRTMRWYELGGKVRIYNNFYVSEMPPTHADGRLCSRYFYSDRAILDSFWTIDRRGGPVSKKRLKSIIPYKESDLVFKVRRKNE